MKTLKYGICAFMVLALAISAAQAEDGGREAESEERDTPRGAAERLRGLDVPERAMEAVESGSEAASDAADRVGRGIERAREAAQRQLDQFQTVHLRRLAQLERVRELADEQGRADALERVERLIEREMERYGSQLARVQERLGLVPEDDDADEE